LATAAKAQFEEPMPAPVDSIVYEPIAPQPAETPNVYSNEAREEYYKQPLDGMQPDPKALKQKADALNFDEKKEKEKKKEDEDFDFNKGRGWQGFGFFSTGTLKVLAYVLAFSVLAFLVYYLLSLRMRKNDNMDELVQVGMAEITNAENLEKLQVDDLLNEALARGDLKLAIRLLYLKILKELFLKGWVRPSSEKTNLDYLRELSGTEFRQGFMETTGYFEKVFYGDFALERKSYDQLSGRFYALFHAIRLK
jgi:hypothetical protein